MFAGIDGRCAIDEATVSGDALRLIFQLCFVVSYITNPRCSSAMSGLKLLLILTIIIRSMAHKADGSVKLTIYGTEFIWDGNKDDFVPLHMYY